MLFSTEFESKTKFIFDIFDIDSDGFISSNDVKGVLIYLSLKIPVFLFINLEFV